jgi:hypothetical protein
MLLILNRVKEDRNLSSTIKAKIYQSVSLSLIYVRLAIFIQPYQYISWLTLAAKYECSIVLLI